MIQDEQILLRTPILSDLPLLMQWENDIANWGVSETKQAFDEVTMIAFIESDHVLEKNMQLRLMIVNKLDDQVVGTLDLFDFDSINQRVGVGILIGNQEHRQNNYATKAIALFLSQAKNKWPLKQIFVSMFTTNNSSVGLFTKLGFETIGVRRNWYFVNDHWEDELLMQYML